MRIEKQLSVFLENRPGAMAKVCGTLSEAGINVQALTVHDTVDHAIVRIIADHYVKALLLLEQQGLHIAEHDVIVMEMDNRPGALADIARKLAHADMNISYAYCTASEKQAFGCLVMKVENSERALEILSG